MPKIWRNEGGPHRFAGPVRARPAGAADWLMTESVGAGWEVERDEPPSAEPGRWVLAGPPPEESPADSPPPAPAAARPSPAGPKPPAAPKSGTTAGRNRPPGRSRPAP